MKCAHGALLVATMCLGAGARAQELTISGRVVSADGKPLTRAFVYLDSLKLICQIDSSGNYVLPVPLSAAQGQPEKLIAIAAEHIRSGAPVTLAGAAIWQDFVLQVDTMPEHKRMHPMLSDGRTEKSATDFAISGRVTDSAGAAMRTATVSLDPGGFHALADDSGHYTLVVPARLRRHSVVLSASLLGYDRTSDSTLLADEHTTRDFVLRLPIYTGTAEPLDSEVARAAGLTDLRNGPHLRGDREIRIRTEMGYVWPNLLYRIVNRSGKTTGDLIRYVEPRDGDVRLAAESAAGSPLRQCTGTIREVLPCRARFTQRVEWGRLWKTLDSLDIWSIADEGTLHKRRMLVLDGSSMTAELWDGKSYRAWAHADGVEDDDPGRERITVVAKLLKEIALLMSP